MYRGRIRGAQMDHTTTFDRASARRPLLGMTLAAVVVATMAAGLVVSPASARAGRTVRLGGVRGASVTSPGGVLRPGSISYLRDDPRTVRSLVPARTLAPATT